MAFDFLNYLPSYNIVWDSPSRDSMDSMPLSGRLGAGANVWVQDGSIWIYLGHNSAYDENGRLLKPGCLRITPTDGWPTGGSFRQELDLPSGRIRITAQTSDGEKFEALLCFAGETLIIEISGSPSLEVAFATWRDRDRKGLHLEVPVDVCDRTHDVGKDHVLPTADGLLWWHDNREFPSELADDLVRQTWAVGHIHNPAEGLVFGGALASAQPLTLICDEAVQWQNWEGRAWRCQVETPESHVFAVALRAQKNGDPHSWLTEANALLDPATRAATAKEEQVRWDEFWSRSHIVINPQASETNPGWQVGRNYQLFRYMLACNRGGPLPLLFNGGIFTTDAMPGRITENNGEIPLEPAGPSTPDFRRWMFCAFMSQNQRWLGWPMIASGDRDLLEPSIAFYRDRAVTAAARARTWGAEGVAFPEPQKLWGLSWNAGPDGKCRAEHLTENFNMGLEHAWMALCAHSVLGTDIRPDLDWIVDTVRFFDSYYRALTKQRTGTELSHDGKLVIYPSTSIELAVGATNPIEVICGLRRVTDALINLPDPLLPITTQNHLQDFQSVIPELPKGHVNGSEVLLPAEASEKEFNLWELPELYAAWPYRLVGVLHPETLDLACTTWEHIPNHRAKLCKQDLSWMPAVVNMAALGLTAEAGRRIVEKLSNQKSQVRFPAFFGPGHDWLPDHNWGGSAMTGLQEMLVAADPLESKPALLLPAWPNEWEVAFKLHVANPAIIVGHYRNGRLVDFCTEPSKPPA
jgi:hypothetical protein